MPAPKKKSKKTLKAVGGIIVVVLGVLFGPKAAHALFSFSSNSARTLGGNSPAAVQNGGSNNSLVAVSGGAGPINTGGGAQNTYNNIGPVNSGSGTQTIYNTYIPAPNEGLIPGTKITDAQMLERFPFGYVIFNQGQDGMRNVILPRRGRWTWQGNWLKVGITPDFANGTVDWTVPSDIYAEGSDVGSFIRGTTFHDTVPMDDKEHIRRTIVVQNQPSIFYLTLSSNQASPVFALGFRLPTAKN